MKEFYEMENLKSKLDQKLRVIRQAEQNDIQPDKKKSVLERLKENEKSVKEREWPKSLNKQKKHDWLDR